MAPTVAIHQRENKVAGRGHSMTSSTRHGTQWTALSFLLLLCMVSTATAATTTVAPVPTETIIMDTRIPVYRDGLWTMMDPQELGLKKRNHGLVKRSTATLSIEISTASGSSSTTVSKPTTLPSPYDSGLSSNFTSNKCPQFFTKFLSDPHFKACYPFSLLLQTSNGFFEAEMSLVGITQVLDATCRADVKSCQNYFDDLAQQLKNPANCGDDLAQRNSLVSQAYLAMISYSTLYTASCQKDTKTSAYCFANAITNRTTQANVYLYWLPFNETYTSTQAPTCNQCLKDIMSGYQTAAANRSAPIAFTYQSAAQKIDEQCGADFINATLPNAFKSGGLSRSVLGVQTWAVPLFTMFTLSALYGWL